MDERKTLIQEVLDRLMYCDGYEKELKNLNSLYNPHEKVKFSNNVEDFKFPLDKAI